MENGTFFVIYIPADLAEMSEEEILENFSPEEYKKYEKTFKKLFRILKELKMPQIDEIESDIFAKVEKFKEISDRYSISNIYKKNSKLVNYSHLEKWGLLAISLLKYFNFLKQKFNRFSNEKVIKKGI